MNKYYAYGHQHGSYMLEDETINRDTFLAYMERRMPAHGLEAYMDGVMAGLLGECKRGYRYLRGEI